MLPVPQRSPPRSLPPEEKLRNLFGSGAKDPVGHQQHVGEQGSKRHSRISNVHALARGGSSVGEGLTEQLMPLVYGLCFHIFSGHTLRLMHDERWGSAFHAAALRAAQRQTASLRAARICVLGIGSCVPALAAAKAGAQVLWVERVERFAECARSLARRNAVPVQVVRRAEWTKLTLGAGQQPFDTVITEEVGDDLLEDGLLTIARHAITHLLPPAPNSSPSPGLRFIPARATAYGCLVSLRVGEISGFDLRAFNAFRSNESVFVDIEHLEATDHFGRHRAVLLSAPARLFHFDFERADQIPPAGRTHHLRLTATREGLLNALVTWFELNLDAEATVGTAPAMGRAARPFWRRARGQRLHFLGYERALAPGDGVACVASHDDDSLRLVAEADADAARRGRLVVWPQINSLAYHWPMIADEGRNGCFDRALGRAITRLTASGTPSHVLDIGSGSGLLAMMAARAGAARVTSLEMVPALAAAARHITRENGYGRRVTILGQKSTDLNEQDLHGRADLLVCEIVDDQLLGEGVLSTVQDARRRLLRPNAQIIPSGAVVYVLAVEMRAPSRSGLQLDDANLFACDQAMCPRAHTGVKLQELAPHDYRALADPLPIFSFDWATAPVESLCDARVSEHELLLTRGGTLNALLVYFHLRCDEDDVYSSGPDNPQLVAWDQNLRYLPIEVRVQAGLRLQVRAEHDEQMVRVGLPQLRPEWIEGSVGHTQLLSRPNV